MIGTPQVPIIFNFIFYKKPNAILCLILTLSYLKLNLYT